MLNVKKNLLLLVIILLPVHIKNAHSTERKGFSGQWCWTKNNKNNTFSITINKSASFYKGSYSSVALSGEKIEESENAFNFKLRSPPSIKIKFKTGITGNFGVVQLTFINSKKMEWHIVKFPRGEFYAPKKAVMYKCSGSY